MLKLKAPSLGGFSSEPPSGALAPHRPSSDSPPEGALSRRPSPSKEK